MTIRRLHPYVVALVAIVLVLPILLAGCAANADKHALYHCPMHPNYVSDRPGDCPICGMKLVAMDSGKTQQAARQRAAQPAVAKAPAVAEAGTREADDLHVGQATAQSMPDMPGMPGMPAPSAPAPQAKPEEHQHQQPTTEGRAAVHADTEQAQLAGVRTVAATRGTLTGTIRAVGTVVTPETGVRQVTTRVGGWVQKLYVNAIGRPVRAGEPLFELYSPELVATQEEYLHARQVSAQFASSSVPEVQHGGQELLISARRRLELFDVPPEFLARLDETGKAQRAVTFRAPFSGYVLEKAVVEGQRVEPGMNLMTIADLSRAWVTAQVYESESAAAKPGRTARVTLPYDDSVRLTGRIDLVYPTLETESRTLKVRLQFPNPRLALKPGMFVNVELDAQRAEGIIVPDSAVIDTGSRQVIFVQTRPGHFEPRDVQAGLRSDGQVIVRAGVQAGEQVAVAANFLLDSESRLRAAIR